VRALLDSGSSTTILREEAARQLGTRLNFEEVAVTTLHGTNTEKMASVKLQVSPDCKQ
jgi:predicted aspartyl protease